VASLFYRRNKNVSVSFSIGRFESAASTVVSLFEPVGLLHYYTMHL